MTMNAKRKLEEFIFKLSITQNNSSHVDLLNKLKLKVNLENQKINDNNLDNKSINKFI
jgi:hypothetical protein